MNFNPYASPKSKLDDVRWEACRREGKLLVMRVGSELPHRCVKCNDVAQEPIKGRWIFWHHPAWYLLLLLSVWPYVLVAMFIRRRHKIAPGLCLTHARKRRLVLAVAWITLISGIAAIFAVVAYDYDSLIAEVGNVAIVASVLIGIFGTRIVYPSRITSDEIYLKGCGAAFLDSLEER